MRPARSKAAMRAAYLELLGEMPAHSITVRNLVERAGVNRSTFYRNYVALDDILDDILDGLDLDAEGILPDAVRGERVIDRIEAHLLQHKENSAVARTILLSERAPALEAHMERKILLMLESGAYSGNVREDVPTSLYSYFFAAGLTRMICEWTRRGCEGDVGAIARQILAAVRTINTGE